HEFNETGMCETLGYDSPMDLIERYPEFFWEQIQPYIKDALRYLELTMEGKQWVAQLYNHIFQVEHRASYIGPFPGPRNT
ncbi:MAG: metal-dependent phosphohydrolase, partial [Pseudomonadota bacterium]